MNPNSRIFTSTYRVKWLKSKLTQKVKINIDENNLILHLEVQFGKMNETTENCSQARYARTILKSDNISSKI